MTESSTSAKDEGVGHYPLCFGCGEINPNSMGVRAFRNGDRVRAEWTPPPMTEGGPGIVHGGYLAAVVDEIQALLASAVTKVPAMTADIQVSYLAPTLSGRLVILEAEVVERQGTKLSISMQAVAADSGTVCFTGKGTYIAVPTRYWSAQAEKLGIDIALLDLRGGDVSTFWVWHARWLCDAYRARGPVDPVHLVVEFEDVQPTTWSMTINKAELRIEPDESPAKQADASIAISFPIWQTLLKERRQDSNASGVVSELGGRVEGDPAALNRFFALLPK